jgi:hypothetical protein
VSSPQLKLKIEQDLKLLPLTDDRDIEELTVNELNFDNENYMINKRFLGKISSNFIIIII